MGKLSPIVVAQVIGALMAKSAQVKPPRGGQAVASQRASQLLDGYEGYRSKAYKDTAGNWTVGTGQLVNNPNATTTRAANQRFKEEHLAKNLAAIRTKVGRDNWNHLKPDMRAAVQSGYYQNSNFLGPRATAHLKAIAAHTASGNTAPNPHVASWQKEWSYGHKGGVTKNKPDGVQGLRNRKSSEGNVGAAAYGRPPLPTPQSEKARAAAYQQFSNPTPAAGGKVPVQR